MTDIAITYEDGLRLSELQGQLAQLQYDLNHIDVTTLPEKIKICIILALVGLFVLWIVLAILSELADGCFWDDRSEAILYSVGALAVIIGFVVIAILATGWYEQLCIVDLESQMANVQGQMDAIYAKYGGA